MKALGGFVVEMPKEADSIDIIEHAQSGYVMELPAVLKDRNEDEKDQTNN